MSVAIEEQAVPFTVPAGFVAEQVAGAPLVKHPMFACFDDRGRLYVAGSSGHNLDAKALLATTPDVIRRLEDTDGDGRFDTSVIFADRLTFPEGILWHDGAVFTASPPSLWRLEDTDGDGFADRRQELVTGFPFTGIADDLHGPCLGPDGRIYWGVGRFDYAIKLPSGKLIRKGKAPLIMRCRPDGRDVEVFCAAMGNPVEVAFTEEGEPLACGTFLAPESMGEGLRDAIIHCVRGGVYAVRDRAISEDKRTGELLPPLAHLGVAAGSGVMRARGPVFGSGERVELFSALFNMHRIQRHSLEREGATFHSHDEPFLVSDVTDFHPTDVLEDADGSLLVVDTGGWFRSCPTSQIEKKHVEGAIYRVRRQGSVPVSDPWGLRLAWDRLDPGELEGRLDDPRFAVRDRAVRELATLGPAAVAALEGVLRGSASVRARLGAVWALARIECDGARAATRVALGDSEMSVRLAAANSVGLNRDPESLSRLMEMAKSDQLPVRREAATALGCIGRSEAVPALLEGLQSGGDRFLDHAQIYALIAIADRRATLAGLGDTNPLVRRGALIALDQMDGGQLTPRLVTPLLDDPNPDLQQAALQVMAHRPDWAEHMVGRFRRWLFQDRLDDRRRTVLKHQLQAFCADPAIQELMASALLDDSTAVETRLLLLESIAQVPVEEAPSSWLAAVRRRLDDADERVVRQAVSTVRARSWAHCDEVLLRLGRNPEVGVELRVEALDAAAPRLKRLDPALFELLVALVNSEQSPLLRLTAARVLGQVPLHADQPARLATAIQQAGALALPRLLPAFEHCTDPRVGAKLVASLGHSPGLRSLTPEVLRKTLDALPAEIQRMADPLIDQLSLDEAGKAARLAQFERLLDQGDSGRGHEIFFGTKATCSTCHSVHAEGGHVGPDLRRIGAIRSGRDLLEAILFPSASFARGFEPYTIETRDGRTYAGLIKRETADAIYMLTPDRVEIPVPRASIQSMEQSRVSIMPRGLEGRLSNLELADLVTFLKSLQ